MIGWRLFGRSSLNAIGRFESRRCSRRSMVTSSPSRSAGRPVAELGAACSRIGRFWSGRSWRASRRFLSWKTMPAFGRHFAAIQCRERSGRRDWTDRRRLVESSYELLSLERTFAAAAVRAVPRLLVQWRALRSSALGNGFARPGRLVCGPTRRQRRAIRDSSLVQSASRLRRRTLARWVGRRSSFAA